MGEAIVPIVLSVASTAVSIYSSVSAGKKEEHAEKNVARQLRQQAIQKAEDTAKEHRRILAIQRAKYGASGVTMEGSPLLVQMESLRESEEQLRRIREGGAFEAEVHEEAGEEALKSGYLRGVGAGLAGTTSVVKTGQGYNWW